jgi:hypothetical protein
MWMRIQFIGLLFLTSSLAIAQTVVPAENEDDIYWQPGVQIHFSDYQSENKQDCIESNEKYGLKMASSFTLRGIVDVPKKRGHYDKFYIAPAFCKKCSCQLSEDTLHLKVDHLLFDIAEVCSRNARKELYAMQKEMNADNTYSMVFTTIRSKWEDEMMAFFGPVIREILVEKSDSAYLKFRKLVDDNLLKTSIYATQPEDYQRFITNQPEKGYKMAKVIIGDMRNKESE